MDAVQILGLLGAVFTIAATVQAIGNSKINQSIDAKIAGPQAKQGEQLEGLVRSMDEHRQQSREGLARVEASVREVGRDHDRTRERVAILEARIADSGGFPQFKGRNPP